MMSRWQGLRLLAVLFLLFVPLARAQAQTTVRPEDEYKKLVRVNEDIQPLGEYPFGESISLYDGSLSFRQTDVSLGGNGPLLEFSRILRIEGEARPGRSLPQNTFGDWLIELPHLETFTGEGYTYGSGWHAVTGWEVSVAPGADRYARCTNFEKPPEIWQHIGDSALSSWGPESWWKGYHLVMPGQGNQDLLVNPDPATRNQYPVITKSQWRISCLSSTVDGQPGEGFLAQSPDGTKYWFNRLVYQYAPGMSRSLHTDDLSDARGSPGGFFENLIASHADPIGDLLGLLSGSSLAHALPVSNTLNRKTAQMLVTRIEDRFGNFLTFSYDTAGKLTDIVASDGAHCPFSTSAAPASFRVSPCSPPRAPHGSGHTRITLAARRSRP